MNGKKARHLRKLAQLSSEKRKYQNREYVSFESAVKKKMGAILDPSKPKGEQLTFQEWDQPCKQIERIDGSYKMYKYLKRRYYDANYTMPYYNADNVDKLLKVLEKQAREELGHLKQPSETQEVYNEQDDNANINTKCKLSAGEEDLSPTTGGGLQSGSSPVRHQTEQEGERN